MCFSTWLSREQITVGSSEERHDMKPHVESLTVQDCHTPLHNMHMTALMRVTLQLIPSFLSAFALISKSREQVFKSLIYMTMRTEVPVST